MGEDSRNWGTGQLLGLVEGSWLPEIEPGMTLLGVCSLTMPAGTTCCLWRYGVGRGGCLYLRQRPRRGSWNAGQRVNSESRARSQRRQPGWQLQPSNLDAAEPWAVDFFVVFLARTQLLVPCYGRCLGLGREGVDALWSQGPTTIKPAR